MNNNENRIYIDSTDHLTIGLLDKLGNWKNWQVYLNSHPSEVLHQALFELITKFHLNLCEVDFVLSAGPGSYTGMRLGEGFAKILEWDKKNVYSLFQFDVFRFGGIKKGFWFTPAFKDEIFICSWDEEREFCKKELIPISVFDLAFFKDNFTYGFARGKFKTEIFKEFEISSKLLKETLPFAINEAVRNDKREDAFYFRPIDEEFK